MTMSRYARWAAGTGLATALLLAASCGGGGGGGAPTNASGGGGGGGTGGDGDGSTGIVRPAASCNRDDVLAAVQAAGVGDTVQVPAGTCSWSALSLNKAVHLRGAGIGQTNITLTGELNLRKQSTAVLRVSNFTFIASGSGNSTVAVSIDGAWDNEPVVVQDNEFRVTNSALFRAGTPGGFIAARNRITAGQDDSLFQLKDDAGGEISWQTADTLGTRDTNGRRNHYLEDNIIRGGTNQGVDCDDGARCVYRFNTLTYSSFNSHGYESSPVGMRHFEIYNNTWLYPTNDPECRGSGSPLSDQNWLVRIRGATGVVFNNTMPNIAEACGWGNKDEIWFDIRAAEDFTPNGVDRCQYPIPRQLGQNHNGTAYFPDPIYVWNNSGNPQYGLGYKWISGVNNSCGRDWNYYFQAGRDYVTGVAKPGYTAYPHPHPLVRSAP